MKRDLFAALIGVHYSVRQLQLAADDVRSLLQFGEHGLSSDDWDRFQKFLAHWEVFELDQRACLLAPQGAVNDAK